MHSVTSYARTKNADPKPTEATLSAVASDYSSIVNKFAHDAFPNLSREVAGPLCHYTSFETSQKILEGNTFRLTNVHCMNDYNEMRAGLDIFYKLVNMFGKSQDKVIADFLNILFYTVIIVLDNDEQRAGVFTYLKENDFDRHNPSQF